MAEIKKKYEIINYAIDAISKFSYLGILLIKEFCSLV